MMGILTRDDPQLALARLRDLPRYGSIDLVPEVSSPRPFAWPPEGVYAPLPADPELRHRIVVLDLGVKYNIMRSLRTLGCDVMAVPAKSSADTILALRPDGVVLSPGPGDPALLDYAAGAVKGLLGRTPLMGICLGHQVTGVALGAKCYKLKFGHRGANHPVRDNGTGRVYITAQNHGYAVDGGGLPAAVEVSHEHLNDGTVEGLVHREAPMLTIQYHSEASPGPLDNMYLFERFLELVAAEKGR
jgi:carbamoyl-phosphate synthase small subunit